MVVALYALIIGAGALYVLLFTLETILAWKGAMRGNGGKAQLISPEWEITHTLLVYGFTLFIVSHATLLVLIGGPLLTIASSIIILLIVRGVLYLYVGYTESTSKKVLFVARWLFALACAAQLAAVACLAYALAWAIITMGYVPSTSIVPYALIGLIPTLAICIVPIVLLYRRK